MKNTDTISTFCTMSVYPKDSLFYLHSICDNFSRILNIDQNDVGKEISLIFSQKFVKGIGADFTYVLETKESLITFYEINHRLWNIEIDYKDNYIRLLGTEIHNVNQINQYSKLSDISLKSFKSKGQGVLMLKAKGEHFEVNSISPGVAQALELQVGDSIDCVLSQMKSIASTTILQKCINLGQTARVLDVFSCCKRKQCYYCYIELIPVCNEDQHIMLVIRQLDKESYYKFLYKSVPSPFGELDETFIAVGVYKQGKGGEYVLKHANAYLKRMISGKGNDNIVYDLIVKNCAEYKTVEKAVLFINGVEYYTLGIPNVSKNNIFIMLFEKSSMRNTTERVFSPLTKRENEIAQMLVDGCTIKYISYMLKIAEGTVKKTISNIYKKIGVNSRIELIKEIFHS